MDNLKMLPEYLFSVGHSMQDISPDDFSMLKRTDANGNSTDMDICPTLIYKIQNASPLNAATVANLSKQSNNEPNKIPAKLDDINTIDLFPPKYQMHDTHRLFDLNNTNLLLQGSDDPLISHGANNVLSHDDEYPADFEKYLITQETNVFEKNVNRKDNQERLTNLLNQQKPEQRVVKSGCSNLTKQQLKVKANLMSARNQQQQQQQQQQQSQKVTSPRNISRKTSSLSEKFQGTQKSRSKKESTIKLRFHHQALPAEYLSHYKASQGQSPISKNSQNHKTSNQRSSSKTTSNFQRQSQPRNCHENVRSWLQRIAEIQRTANASKESVKQTQNPLGKQQCEASAANTLNTCTSTDANNNYETQKGFQTKTRGIAATQDGYILADVDKRSNFKRTHYSDLPYMGEITLDNCKPRRGRKPKKADICHLIYKNYGTILPTKTKTENRSNYCASISNNENHCLTPEAFEQPLNLCLRDQAHDSYSISSGDELSETTSACPTPVSANPLDYVHDAMLANTLQKSLNNIDEQNMDAKDLNTSKQCVLSVRDAKELHPIAAMCYKKLLENTVLPGNATGRYKTIKKDNQFALKIPISGGFFPPQTFEKLKKSTTTPVECNLDYPEPLSTPSSVESENSVAPTTTGFMPNQQLITPQKRKRSAIFIPPMNVENSNNPATEVSICKFKFTGGLKPSLEEKKMISVDAGGNYRYFSATGDKASRGYEYFPRESLQHTAGLLPGVNCTGQRLCMDITPSSHGLLHMSSPSTSTAPLPGRSVSVNKNADSPNPVEATHFEPSHINNKLLLSDTT